MINPIVPVKIVGYARGNIRRTVEGVSKLLNSKGKNTQSGTERGYKWSA